MLPQILVMFALKSGVDKITFVTLGENGIKEKKSHTTLQSFNSELLLISSVYKMAYLFLIPQAENPFSFLFFLTARFDYDVTYCNSRRCGKCSII
jgi:hypothetical protein